MSKKKVRIEYDKAFKLEAVKLSESSKQSVEEVAKDLGIAVSNLHRWRREYRSASSLGIIHSLLFRSGKKIKTQPYPNCIEFKRWINIFKV